MTRSAAALATPAPPRLVVATAAAPDGSEPLALLQAFPGTRHFYWEQPSAGVALAGAGATVAFTASGRDRFADLAVALGGLTSDLPEDVVAVGGFSFDEVATVRGPWRGFPAAEWVVPSVALVRRNGRARLIATALRDGGAPPLDAILAKARAALARPPLTSPPSPVFHALGSPAARWRRAVEATLHDVAAGRLSKLVLARACSVRAGACFDPLRVAARLRRAYPGCTLFAVSHGGATFVGASPERLARVAGNRLDTAALAGTAPRGPTPRADRVLARALMESPKERSEHALVVHDVVRRLTSLCDDVVAAPAPRVLATETLQHLHTPIRARLRPGRGLLDAVAALYPTPSICGTPRALARDRLRTRERFSRGWYAGGIGWLDARGGEVVVALRTALLRGAHALLHAGAGIVTGSTWEAELEETRLKMRPLLAALLEL